MFSADTIDSKNVLARVRASCQRMNVLFSNLSLGDELITTLYATVAAASHFVSGTCENVDTVSEQL